MVWIISNIGANNIWSVLALTIRLLPTVRERNTSVSMSRVTSLCVTAMLTPDRRLTSEIVN